jgi:Na+-driven multidrug efflux pump
VHQGLRAASVIGIVYCTCALAVVLCFARSLLGLFIDSGSASQVTEMGVRYLIINAAYYIPLLFVNILRLSIQGMGFTKVAMLAGLSEMAARTAVALFLVPAAGFTGACFANPAAWIMADLFLFPCYARVMRSLRQRLYDCPDDKPEKQRYPTAA